MTQIFVFGASVAYGVGAEDAGWSDLLKRWLHHRMYGEGGIGEIHELYNFAQPGATIEFVLATHSEQLKAYRRPGKAMAILCIGGNNAKAVERPDNFVSSPEEYAQTMGRLLSTLKEEVDELLVLPAIVVVDESKTQPKRNMLTGGTSYFSQARVNLFNQTLQNACQKYDVVFVDVAVAHDEWAQSYLYIDGVHPNQQGHQRIFDRVISKIEHILR